MAATWTITNTRYDLSLDGQTNVIYEISWQCTDQDADGNSGRVYNTTAISTDDLTNFTPYDQVTEAMCLQWVQDTLGTERVAAIETEVAEQINAKAHPTTGGGLPWATE